MPCKDERTERLRFMMKEVEDQASFLEHSIEWTYYPRSIEAKCTNCGLELDIWLREKPEYTINKGMFFVPCPGKRT